MHILGKKNLIVDMLFKTRYFKGKKMFIQEEDGDFSKALYLLQVEKIKVMRFYFSKSICMIEG